jgi:hypothetical protein
MSELEDPVTTVVRLLRKNVQVVKDDASIAQIHVSQAWFDRELFKNYDGQITVSLAESQDQKIETAGKLRRRLGFLRVNVWAADKQGSSDSGRLMRNKLVAEVNRVVRQKRSKPNETVYDFVGVGSASNEHKAYHAGSADELSPSSDSWIELASMDYEKLWYSDDTCYSKSHAASSEYALMLFCFKIDCREQTVKQAVLTFEGYGTAPAGNGILAKVWNHTASAWQNAQTGMGETDQTITVTIASDLADYVDDDAYVWLLARTANPSDGATPAILHCDYASCAITVNGITYLDVVSFRDVDFIDVKPFIYRTEFALKSWFFENVGGA